VELWSSRSEGLAKIQRPSLVEEQLTESREQDICSNRLERKGRDRSELRLGQPVLECRSKAMMPGPGEGAADFSFRLTAPAVKVNPRRFQQGSGLRPELRRDFFVEHYLLHVQIAQSPHHLDQTGQVFLVDLGRKPYRRRAGRDGAADSTARDPEIMNSIRAGIGGHSLFSFRHFLTTFPQRGFCVIAEGQVWDVASFRSGLSGFIVLRPVPIQGDNVKRKSPFHNEDV